MVQVDSLFLFDEGRCMPGSYRRLEPSPLHTATKVQLCRLPWSCDSAGVSSGEAGVWGGGEVRVLAVLVLS